MNYSRHQNYKNKQLNNPRKSRVLKVKKIRKDFKPIDISIDEKS